MDQVAWLTLALGVSGMMLAQVLLAKSNPDEKIPFWWGGSGDDPPVVKRARALGSLLAFAGAALLFQVKDLNGVETLGAVMGAYTPIVLVAVIHNARIGQDRSAARS